MATQSATNPELIQLDDRRIRLLFAPVLGLAIAGTTGLYSGMSPREPIYWLASGYFVLVSFVIWQGNRFLWNKLRGKPDWLEHPVWRLLLLGATSFSYTAVVSVALLVAWQRLAGPPQMNWRVIEISTVATVISVAFIVHTYETVYLIRQRRQDQAAYATIDRARARAEVTALESQIDPHFVFNSLNTLVELTEQDPERATAFTLILADIYRYIVANRNRELIPLVEEFTFLEKYQSLLRERFGESVRLRLPALTPQYEHYLIPPVSLQLLLENAVKHNQFSEDKPLLVEIDLSGRAVTFWHETRQTRARSPGSQTGLKNLDERCKLVSGEGIQIRSDGAKFMVVVPLV
jgi:Histidine kinase